MKVEQHDPENKPEAFYMPRDTGEVRPVYDEDHVEVGTEPIIAYDNATVPGSRVDGLHKLRKSKAGIQELCITENSQELWDTVDGVQTLVAEQRWYGEYEESPGVWVVPQSTVTIEARETGEIVGTRTLTQFGGELVVSSPWVPSCVNKDSDKQTATFSMPNQTVRVKWWVKLYKFSSEVKASFGHEDYSGNKLESIVEDTPDYQIVEVIFEPDGVADELIVDPYLSVDEPVGFIDVTCDGFVVSIQTDTTDDISFIGIKTSDTERLAIASSISGYNLGYYSRVSEVLFNSSTRVEVLVSGGVANTYGGSNPTGITDFRLRLFIYPDRIAVTAEVDVDSNTFTVGNTANVYRMITVSGTGTDIGESGGAEVSTFSYNFYNTAKYLGGVFTDVTAILTMLSNAMSGASYAQYYAGGGYFNFGPHDGILPEGTHSVSAMLIMDSVEREGGKRYDGHTLPANIEVNDSFDTDTSANYHQIATGSPAASFGSGIVTPSTTWDDAAYLYDTALGTTRHWVIASANPVRNAYIFINYDKTLGQGYGLSLASATGIISLNSIAGTTASWKAQVNSQYSSFTAGVFYELFVICIADYTFQIYVDGVYAGTVVDGDSTYTGGQYAGFHIDSGADDFSEISDFSCGTFSADERLLMGNQYYDIATNTLLPTIDTGSAVTDLNIPDHIDEGICTDGAQHIDLASGEAKITHNQSAINQALVLHEASVRTGTVGSPTEHLIGHWKCDDNAASSVVAAEVGQDAVWKLAGVTPTERNTNTAGDSVTGVVRGRSLDQQSPDLATSRGISIIALPAGVGTCQDNAFFQSGTIDITCKPDMDFDHTDSGLRFLYHLRISSTDQVLIWYATASERFEYYVEWGNVSMSINGIPFTSDADLNRKHNFQFSWDATTKHVCAVMDGVVQGSFTHTATPTSSQPIKSTLGAQINTVSTASVGAFIFDDIKAYNKLILPHGSFIPGNLTDYTKAHSDIVFYWDCESLTAKRTSGLSANVLGVKTGTTNDITTESKLLGTYGFDNGSEGTTNRVDFTVGSEILMAKGRAGFWINPQALVGASHGLFGILADSINYLSIFSDTSTSIKLRYAANGTTRDSVGLTVPTTGWFWVDVMWSDAVNGSLCTLEVNGSSISITNPGTVGATPVSKVRFGNLPQIDSTYSTDAWYDLCFITNNQNTPQVPFIPGSGPIHQPLLSKNGTLVQPGSAYQIEWEG